MNRGRREFINALLKVIGGVTLGSLALGLHVRQSKALPATAIRPPGALGEDEFSGACIRCGLCVRDCPYDTLRLAKTGEMITLGTPYFIARQVPCEMCEDIPCVAACPTGALNQDLTDINDARMGLAVVIDQEGCIAFQGLRCEVCYNVCPIRGSAIILKPRHNQRTDMHASLIPIVRSSACTGCGKCEAACIVDGEAAIKVIPTHLAKSGGSAHYRFGWEEKEKLGKALVTPDAKHQYNLPQGMAYDHAGKGLIKKPNPQESLPIPDDPLETLNREHFNLGK